MVRKRDNGREIKTRGEIERKGKGDRKKENEGREREGRERTGEKEKQRKREGKRE